MNVSSDEVKAQSKNAYNQWCHQWREHAKIHGNWVQKSLKDFENIGVGKAVLLVANGYSFEENIETIKKYRENVDIMACDKTIGNLIRHGIEPDYCLVADANVNYEKYCAPWKDQLNRTILFMNICGNPKWTANANWKDRYFFANSDVLNSEYEFMHLGQCPNEIAAGTNVSNAMVIFVTQCKNQGRSNFFGYDKILLIGFDYSFKKNYYAFDATGDGKLNYMNHEILKWRNDEFAYSSGNLIFSARWLTDYINVFKLPIVQCTEKTVLSLPNHSTLERQMQYRGKIEDRKKVWSIMKKKRTLMGKVDELNQKLMAIGKQHFNDYIESV